MEVLRGKLADAELSSQQRGWVAQSASDMLQTFKDKAGPDAKL